MLQAWMPDLRRAASHLATLSSRERDGLLLSWADDLLAQRDAILAANEVDLAQGRKKGLSEALLDRLRLTPERLRGMAQALREVALLPDPLGETVRGWRRPNGLEIRQVRVPLGVVGIIYEARPNVTVDAAGLCLKTGNAVILRGGSEAYTTNEAIVSVLQQGLKAQSLPIMAVSLAPPGRESAAALMQLKGLDVLVPRGGKALIDRVVQEARVPVIETGAGVCHAYVEASSDLATAVQIVVNGKTQRPSVCNALETLLVEESAVESHLPAILQALFDKGVEVRGCPRTQKLDSRVMPAHEADWDAEYLALIVSVRVVKDLDEALSHIERHGTRHSEVILTRNREHARLFQQKVDAAAVYVNASTRFTDGGEFGFGAELGISTQKLHARGPMGLVALTSIKYLVDGDGQVRD